MDTSLNSRGSENSIVPPPFLTSMQTKHIFTEEEFNIIVKSLEDILGYCHAWGKTDIITCENDIHEKSTAIENILGYFQAEDDTRKKGTSMSVETFIEDLRRELSVE